MADKEYAFKSRDLAMAIQNTDDKSVLDVLQTFGLSQEDLYSLSRYSAEELTVEKLPGILQAYMKEKFAHGHKSSADLSALHSRSRHVQRERLNPSPSSQFVSHSKMPHVPKEWGYRSHSPSPPICDEKAPHKQNLSPLCSTSRSSISCSKSLHVQKPRDSHLSGSLSPPVIRSGFEHLNKSGTGRLFSQTSVFAPHKAMASNSLAHILDDFFEDPEVVDYSHGSSSQEKVISQQVKEAQFTFLETKKTTLDEFWETYQRKPLVEEPKNLQHTQDLATPLQHFGENIHLAQSRHKLLSQHPSEEQRNRFESTGFISRVETTIHSNCDYTVESQNPQGQTAHFNNNIDCLSSFLRQQKLQVQTHLQNPAVKFSPLQQEQMPSINFPHQQMQGSHGFQQHVPICAPPVFAGVPPQLSGNIIPPQANPVTLEMSETITYPSIPGYAGSLQANPLSHEPLGSDNVHSPSLAYTGSLPPTVNAHPEIRHIPPTFPEYKTQPQINLPMPQNWRFNNAQPNFHGNPSFAPSGLPMLPPPQEFMNVQPCFPRIAGPPPRNWTMLQGENYAKSPFPEGAAPLPVNQTMPLPNERFPRPDYHHRNTPGIAINKQSLIIKRNVYVMNSEKKNSEGRLRFLTDVLCTSNIPVTSSSMADIVRVSGGTSSVRKEDKIKELDAHLEDQTQVTNIQNIGVQFANELKSMKMPSTSNAYEDLQITGLSLETIRAIERPKFLSRKQPTNEELQNYKGTYHINGQYICYLCMDENANETEMNLHLKQPLHNGRHKAFGIRFSKHLEYIRNMSKESPDVNCPKTCVAATTTSSNTMGHSTQAAKITTLQPHTLPAISRNALQPDVPATTFTKSVRTFDTKTSETDAFGAKSVPSPSPAKGASPTSAEKVTSSTQPLNVNLRPKNKVDDDLRTVFVSGFSRETTVNKLKNFFRHFGKVVGVVICYSRSGTSQRCGHVTFGRAGHVKFLLAKAKDGLPFETNTLLVSPFSASRITHASTSSKPSAIKPQPITKAVAGAESQDMSLEKEAATQGKVVSKLLHATIGAPAEEQVSDRRDTAVTETPASTSQEQDAGLPDWETKAAGKQPSCKRLDLESVDPSLQTRPPPKASGDTKEGKNEEPVSKKAKRLVKNTSSQKRAPIGVEFIAPGFYCKLCSSLFVKEESIRKHCYNQVHQQYLQKKKPR